ncbi:hypothetical protein AX16_001940 [Volvariella volvacea WC 439]|nr:hypothetical protein AX16_001940 [Volvariella volvacea WC 439]
MAGIVIPGVDDGGGELQWRYEARPSPSGSNKDKYRASLAAPKLQHQTTSIMVAEHQAVKQCPTLGLPSPVLLHIFKLLYIHSRTSITWQDRHATVAELARKSVWVEESVHSPALFPFALASVCKAWRGLLMTVPEFWTRCVIHIDNPSLSLSTARLYIESSATLALDIHIVRRVREQGSVDPPEERQLVNSIMKLFAPHATRCKTLHIQTEYSSSLPSLLSLTMNNGFTSLTTLNLKYNTEDQIHKPIIPNTPLRLNPGLSFLLLDGFNFCILCRLPLPLKPHFIRLHRLSISNYHPEHHTRPLTYHEFMLTLVHFTPYYLALDDVQLTYEPLENPSLLYTVDVNELLFTNIPSPFIRHFFMSAIIYPEGITIKHSTIATPLSCNILSLHDLSEDEDLCLVLGDWMLASQRRYMGGMMIFTELTIRDCVNFSPVELKKVVQTSMLGVVSGADAGYADMDRVLAQSVEGGGVQKVKGEGRVPKLDTELRSWFKANLVEFLWDGSDEE